MSEKRKRSESPSETEFELVVRDTGERSEKKAKTEAEEPSTPQPLTEENLRLLEGVTMPKKPKKGSSKGVSTVDSNTALGSTTVSDVRKLKEQFEHYHLFIGDKATKNSKVVEKAREVIDSDRNSAMKNEEQEEIKEAREDNEWLSEADFIEEFWTLVILPKRSVKELGEENVAKATDGQLLKAWKKDHLAIARDKLFRRDSIPMTDTSDNPILARFLDDLPKVKTPKPDRAYGLAKSAFTEKERVINDIMAYLSKVSSQMYHTFFIVEFQSITHPIAEARLQACHGGAAMINVMRQLKTKARISNDNDQLDAGSFVFSIAMVPGQAGLYVHWAEPPTPPSKAVNFHMHKLNTYSLDKGPDLAELRHDVNNVLDWGVVERRNYIKGLLPLIAEQDPGIQRKIKEQQEQVPLVALSGDEDELQSL